MQAFEAKKGSQIAVLIVPTTQPEEIEQFGIRVAEAWKLGRKGIDDGAILMVAKDDRRVRIEVGYGLEGALPDAIANRIIDETITPHFKLGDFDGGVEAGVDAVIAVVDGEPLPAPDRKWEHAAATSAICCRSSWCWWSSSAACCGPCSAGCSARIATGGLAGVIVWFLSHVLPIGLGAGVVGFLFAMLLAVTRGWSRAAAAGAGASAAAWAGWRRLRRRRIGGGFSGGGGGFGGGGASGSW